MHGSIFLPALSRFCSTGCKLSKVTVVYTPFTNLMKTARMDTGQVGFVDQKKVCYYLYQTYTSNSGGYRDGNGLQILHIIIYATLGCFLAVLAVSLASVKQNGR